MIRVLIVDDSAFVRQALTRMLGGAPDIEVVGTAVDGKDGWEKALDLRPDVVTLDVKISAVFLKLCGGFSGQLHLPPLDIPLPRHRRVAPPLRASIAKL